MILKRRYIFYLMTSLPESTPFRVIAKGAGIVFLGLAASKVLSFLYRLLIVHTYTVADYGLFSEGVAIISLLKTLSLFGMFLAVTRFVASFNARGNTVGVRKVISKTANYTVPASILLSAILYVSSDQIALFAFNEPQLGPFLRVFSLSLPFYSLSLLLAYYFTGLKMAKEQIALQEVIPSALKLIVLACIWIIGFGSIGVALSWTATYILVAFTAIVAVRRTKPFSENAVGKPPGRLGWEIILFSAPVFVSDLVNTLMSYMGTIAVGLFDGVSMVGVYNAAVPMADMLMLIPLSFTALFMPVITECYTLRRTRMANKVSRFVVKWVFLINLMVFLPLAFFSPQILTAMFGEQYAQGWLALSILAAGFMINSLEVTATGILLAIKKTRYIMFSMLTAATTCVMLSFYLVPVYGVVGAALATAASFIVRTFVSIIVVWKLKGFNPFGIYVIRGLFAGSISLGAVYALHVLTSASGLLAFAILYLIFCAAYVISLAVLRCFDEADLEMIISAGKRVGVNLSFMEKVSKF